MCSNCQCSHYAKRTLNSVIHLTPQTHPNLWEYVLRGGDSDLFTMTVRNHGIIYSVGEVRNYLFHQAMCAVVVSKTSCKDRNHRILRGVITPHQDFFFFAKIMNFLDF